MKKLIWTMALMLVCGMSFAQAPQSQIGGKEVYKGPDIVFHEIDAHTWVGTAHMMYNESVYLIEGSKKALLIDAGTKIDHLDKIVAGITKKPVMLVATHVHPDHTGSAINDFPEIWINEADTVNIPMFMKGYPGKVSYLKDGQVIDLGGRKINVVFVPGHTPGSTAFIDKAAHYGFSGDAFGSGNLLLSLDFSTLIATCQKMDKVITKDKLTKLYPGHYNGGNPETPQRIKDMITLSQDILSGKIKGEVNKQGMMGLNLIVTKYGVRINYNEKSLK